MFPAAHLIDGIVQMPIDAATDSFSLTIANARPYLPRTRKNARAKSMAAMIMTR